MLVTSQFVTSDYFIWSFRKRYSEKLLFLLLKNWDVLYDHLLSFEGVLEREYDLLKSDFHGYSTAACIVERHKKNVNCSTAAAEK